MEIRSAVLDRLRFQSQAAEVQLAMTDVVRHVFTFLLNAHSMTRDEKRATAADVVAQFSREKERWHNLRPPDQLKAVWLDLDEGFGHLGQLVEKTRAVSGLSQPALQREVVTLQRQFGERLYALNMLEGKLLEEEERLRKLHQAEHTSAGHAAGEDGT